MLVPASTASLLPSLVASQQPPQSAGCWRYYNKQHRLKVATNSNKTKEQQRNTLAQHSAMEALLLMGRKKKSCSLY